MFEDLLTEEFSSALSKVLGTSQWPNKVVLSSPGVVRGYGEGALRVLQVMESAEHGIRWTIGYENFHLWPKELRSPTSKRPEVFSFDPQENMLC